MTSHIESEYEAHISPEKQKASQGKTLRGDCKQSPGYKRRKERIRSRLFQTTPKPFRIGHRFVVLEELGKGGMGEVYKAYDELLHCEVAVKLVRAEQFDDPKAEKRLQREAQTLRDIKHDNVVQMYDVGKHEDRLFFAMELIKGGMSLDKWVKVHAQPSKRRHHQTVLPQLIAAGRGLEAVHNTGLIHRDFKPENVMVDGQGHVRVLDFGLARGDTLSAPHSTRPATPPTDPASKVHSAPEPDATSPSLTTDGALIGTPLYMAPEQMGRKTADARSDQFSYGMVVFEALFGCCPYASTSFRDLRKAKEAGHIVPWPSSNHVPDFVKKALRRTLSAKPEDRFETLSEFLKVLETWQHRRQKYIRGFAVILATVTMAVLLFLVIKDIIISPCDNIDPNGPPGWTDQRHRLQQIFERPELSYAAKSWSRAEALFDRYAQTWVAKDAAWCRAQRAYGESELMDKKKVCLDRSRKDFSIVLNQIELEPQVAARDLMASVALLPDLDRCTDVEGLKYGLEPPPTAVEKTVSNIRGDLTQVRTEFLFGQYDVALNHAQALRSSAEQTGYRPLVAEVMREIGRIQMLHGGQDGEHGQALLLDASDLAEGERHDELLANIWNDLVYSATARRKLDKATTLRWLKRADAITHRIEASPLQRSVLIRMFGLVHAAHGEHQAAENKYRKAMAMLTCNETDPRQPCRTERHNLAYATYQQDLSRAQRHQGQIPEARQNSQAALEILNRILGPEHPTVIEASVELALLGGDFNEAHAELLTQLSYTEAQFGKLHPQVARVRLQTAYKLLVHGNPEAALVHVNEARRVYEYVYGPDHLELAETYGYLGEIAKLQGRRNDALDWFRRTLKIQKKNSDPDPLNPALTEWTMAELFFQQGDYAQATEALDRSAPILLSEDGFPYLANSLRGQILFVQGLRHEARSYLELAVRNWPETTDWRKERGDARWALARVLTAGGTQATPAALRWAQRAQADYLAAGKVGASEAKRIKKWVKTHSNSR